MSQFVKLQYKILAVIFVMILLVVKPVAAKTDTDSEKSVKISGYKSTEMLKLVESAIVSETSNLDELKN